MSICKQIGKDRIIITTKNDHEEPSKIELAPQDPSEHRRGLVLPNGELNWSCPCLGGMPYGPCGFEFREAFSCIHKAQDSENKEHMISPETCFPLFQAMKDCFSKFPKLYPPDDEEDSSHPETSSLPNINQTQTTTDKNIDQ